eukprot:scaffold48444_cov40-Phaeocystis_antarctica.AAC.1
MSKSLLHLLHRELCAGWNSWLAMATERRAALELWLEATRKRASMSTSLLHLLHRELCAGWNSWVAMATESRAALELVRCSLQFMVNRKLAP